MSQLNEKVNVSVGSKRVLRNDTSGSAFRNGSVCDWTYVGNILLATCDKIGCFDFRNDYE